MISGRATYSISGTVYDADGTTPVEGATVALGLLTTTSVADGTFTITDIPAGTSGPMTCTKTGYSWTEISIAAMGGSLTAQNYVNVWYAIGGTYNNIKAFYHPLGAASLDASYVNLIDQGVNNAVPGVTPTFDTSYGWSFNGSSEYLKCPLSMGDNWTVIERYSNGTVGGNKTWWGSADVGSYKLVSANDAGIGDKITVQHGGTALNVFFQQPLGGIIGIAGRQLYVDGVARGSQMGAGSGGAYASAMGIGCFLSGTALTPSGYSAKRTQIFIAYNVTLTLAQIQVINSAMAASTTPLIAGLPEDVFLFASSEQLMLDSVGERLQQG